MPSTGCTLFKSAQLVVARPSSISINHTCKQVHLCRLVISLGALLSDTTQRELYPREHLQMVHSQLQHHTCSKREREARAAGSTLCTSVSAGSGAEEGMAASVAARGAAAACALLMAAMTSSSPKLFPCTSEQIRYHAGQVCKP